MRALRAAYGPHPGRVPCLIQGRAFRDRVAQVARKERFAQPGPILLNRIEVWAARRDVPHAHPGIGVRLLAPCCGQEAFIVAQHCPRAPASVRVQAGQRAQQSAALDSIKPLLCAELLGRVVDDRRKAMRRDAPPQRHCYKGQSRSEAGKLGCVARSLALGVGTLRPKHTQGHFLLRPAQGHNGQFNILPRTCV